MEIIAFGWQNTAEAFVADISMKIKIGNLGRVRNDIKKLVCSHAKTHLPKKRRPLIENPLVEVRQWLTLDTHNSFPMPKKCMSPKLKGETFRFYAALLSLAKRFGNPFNHSDRAMAKEFGFHLSRIPTYKDELEELGLICVALIRPEKLKWPKTHYQIFEFWDNPLLSPLSG